MINWQETFRAYQKWITWEHNTNLSDLCHWYQNRCRIYLDEYEEQDCFNINHLKNMIKTLRPY
jgi:hypothetical protein